MRIQYNANRIACCLQYDISSLDIGYQLSCIQDLRNNENVETFYFCCRYYFRQNLDLRCSYGYIGKLYLFGVRKATRDLDVVLKLCLCYNLQVTYEIQLYTYVLGVAAFY